MQLLHTIKQVAHGPGGVHDLTEDAAYQLFSAMLDAGLADLELGALLIALRLKGESVSELLGFHRAVCERLYPMQLPDSATRPLVIPAYGGARHEANLLPLLGLLLKRLGVPVVFHGMLEGSGRVAAVYILREFGILPSASLPHAQAQLEQEHIAFVPDAVLCPGLAALLALRNRLGVRNSAHVVGKLIDPFSGAGVVMAGAASGACLDRLGAFFVETGTSALLLGSTEGEPFANPRRRPRIDHFDQGERRVLFDEEAGPVKPVAGLPGAIDAHTTAEWMRHALLGEVPIPHPLVNQLACCLYASGYTDDMNQAKAIAAVEAGSLGPVARRRGGASRALRAIMR
jgi:anthranilate phosphoribosyltransferase